MPIAQRPQTRKRVSKSKYIEQRKGALTASALQRLGVTRRARGKSLSPIAEGANEARTPESPKPNLRIKIPYRNYVPEKIQKMIKRREEWPHIHHEIEDLPVSAPIQNKILRSAAALYTRKMKKNGKLMEEFRREAEEEYAAEERQLAEARAKATATRIRRRGATKGVFARIKGFLFGK